jgi:predicted AAA+ superfamily ATPase
MWFKRDLEQTWRSSHALPVRILTGLRQAGKTALLHKLAHEKSSSRECLYFDDLGLRQLASADPALFFDMHPGALFLDEAQMAPQLFFEIKHRIDSFRRERALKEETGSSSLPSNWLWMTGSSAMLMDKQIKESLAGRASFYILHPLAVSEITKSRPETTIANILIRGGWPELRQDTSLDPVRYLNDYIQSALEKDVAVTSGVTKISNFMKATRLLAARVGQLSVASDIAKDSSVQVSTILDWISILERNHFLYRVPAFSNNFNQRLIKTPKLFFSETSLACRLQGWTSISPLLVSPQVGGLFENLVFSEIIRTRDHGGFDWQVFHWRTKEGHEIDFIIQSNSKTLALEVKFNHQNIPSGIDFAPVRKTLGEGVVCAVVTAGGKKRLYPELNRKGKLDTEIWPIQTLAQELLSHLT